MTRNYQNEIQTYNEDLGCPLEIVFSAIKNGIWLKEYNYKVGVGLDTFNYDCEFVLRTYDGKVNVYTKDYGKTWLLENPEEEIEDDYQD